MRHGGLHSLTFPHSLTIVVKASRIHLDWAFALALTLRDQSQSLPRLRQSAHYIGLLVQLPPKLIKTNS
jgi:hypothetical protein